MFAFLRMPTAINKHLMRFRYFVVLYDVSCLLSDFVIPYVKNLDKEVKHPESPKHGKLSGLPIRILVTPTSRSQCAKRLIDLGYVTDEGVADAMVEKLFNNSIFYHGKIDDTPITAKMMRDIEKSEPNGKIEDSLHICTANAYGVPIITGEKQLAQWRRNCKHSVIRNVDFWIFVDDCRKMNDRDKVLSRMEIQKYFDRKFPSPKKQ